MVREHEVLTERSHAEVIILKVVVFAHASAEIGDLHPEYDVMAGKYLIPPNLTPRNVVREIVFQFFQLFPTLTAIENAMLPMDFAKKGKVTERRDIAKKNLDLVGLGDKLNNLPSEMSGGEQQRVAIARSLANDPEIIIGDEPTGNLDSKTEERMFNLLKKLSEHGKTILYVTHSKSLAKKAKRRIKMLDGKIIED